MLIFKVANRVYGKIQHLMQIARKMSCMFVITRQGYSMQDLFFLEHFRENHASITAQVGRP